ncbi:hypothetical protein POM88_025879 [Heracleum sosnowskyi]|uniref:Uncharacterized protein n=1 Tax=Heracleum sosnowskyi TaxID=360622 RepID=A0AAD8I7U4_9APIA|nr:hypothetical protein POM88_025879 [Heracleum sosnowskyi]
MSDVLSAKSLLWKLKLVTLACAFANSRLHAVKAQMLILSRCRAIHKEMGLVVTDAQGYLERTFLSHASVRAGKLISKWMEDAGLTTWVDSMGNVHGRVGGLNPSSKALLIGSHLVKHLLCLIYFCDKLYFFLWLVQFEILFRLVVDSLVFQHDTIIDAGKFDGSLGIVSALSALKVLHVNGRLEKLRRPVEDKLRPVLTDIRKHADSIKGSQIVTGMDGGNLKADKGRKHLEEEYLELEEKIIILFDVVENMSLMLKKLRKANPDLNFDIGPLSATPTSGQDDNNTPTTQGGTEF